jgi:hypothetical protein
MAEAHLQVDNGLQITLTWVPLTGFRANNVLHAEIPPGLAVTPALADAITGALNSLYTSSGLQAQQPVTTSSPFAVLRDLRTANLPLVSGSTSGLAGTGTGDPLPLRLACCMTFRTNKAGKSFRGRAYLPGFGEAANSPTGQIQSATKTALDSYATGFIAAVNQQGLQLSILKRPLFDANGAITTPGVLTHVTQAIVRNTLWDSQRRRQRRS